MVVVQVFGNLTRTLRAAEDFIRIHRQVKQVRSPHPVGFIVRNQQVDGAVCFFPGGNLQIWDVEGLLLIFRVVEDEERLAGDLDLRDGFRRKSSYIQGQRRSMAQAPARALNRQRQIAGRRIRRNHKRQLRRGIGIDRERTRRGTNDASRQSRHGDRDRA